MATLGTIGLLAWGDTVFSQEKSQPFPEEIRNLHLDINSTLRSKVVLIPKGNDTNLFFDPLLQYKASSVGPDSCLVSDYFDKAGLWHRIPVKTARGSRRLYVKDNDVDRMACVFVELSFRTKTPVKYLGVHLTQADEPLKNTIYWCRDLTPEGARYLLVPLTVKKEGPTPTDQDLWNLFCSRTRILVTLDEKRFYSFPVGEEKRTEQLVKQCPTCRGNGWIRCPQCKGTGDPLRVRATKLEQILEQLDENFRLRSMGVYCGLCKNPDGHLTCRNCNGSGEIQLKPVTVTVRKLLLDQVRDGREEFRGMRGEKRRQPSQWFGPDPQAAVGALTAALKHENPAIRIEALIALGELGPEAKKAVPEVSELLQDKDFDVRFRAKIVLRRIAEKPSDR